MSNMQTICSFWIKNEYLRNSIPMVKTKALAEYELGMYMLQARHFIHSDTEYVTYCRR